MTQATEYAVKLVGRRPLLMHRIPPDMNGKTKKRGNEYDPQEESEKALYRDADDNIVVPSLNLLAALKKAGVEFRVPGKGRKTYKTYIYSGVSIDPGDVPISIPGGDDPEESWEIDQRPVVISRSRIIRCRPKFNKWSLKFTAFILDPIIQPDALKQIFEAAGKYVGLCDFRPLFGLFDVAEFDKA